MLGTQWTSLAHNLSVSKSLDDDTMIFEVRCQAEETSFSCEAPGAGKRLDDDWTRELVGMQVSGSARSYDARS